MSRKDQYPDDEEDGEQQQKHQQLQLIMRNNNNNTGGDTTGDSGGNNRLRGWHHSSRIIRVSRASGGKDRHSKVWTSKGLRDRRVRLSVTTAIQFYDLQDRLGYDQPSKAVEWLIKAAADSIAELPSLNSSSFPDTPKQLSDEKRASEGTTTDHQQGFDSAELSQGQQKHRSLSKSACSSNSETSKGSGLSLSGSELRGNRVKARERARKRAAKEKEKDNEYHVNANEHHHRHNVNVNPISQSSSFTELLTGGIGGTSVSNNNNTSPNGSSHPATAAARPWPVTPLDYFYSGLLGPSSSRPPHHFSGQIQLGSSNSLPQAMTIPPFSVTNENHHQEMQHFSFVPDHLIPVTATQQGPGGGDYNLNFTVSSGLAGFNRGTLQSNSSPSLLPHLQRFGSSSPLDGSNLPFFVGTTPLAENHHHHQFSTGFDGRLHLYYGDGSRNSDQKGKGKN